MNPYLIVLAVAILIAVIVWWRARRNQRPAEAPKPRTDPLRDEFTEDHNNPEDCKVGDMILLMGITYVVRGYLDFREDGWKWRELFLDDGGSNTGWLSIEHDEGDLNLGWWTGFGDHDFEPGEKTLTVNGTVFARIERGTASYNSYGETGLLPTGEAVYIDYEAKDGRCLSFERWAVDSKSPWELSVGTEIHPNQLTVLPANAA